MQTRAQMVRVMSENSYAIEVQADFLKRQAKAQPLHAVAEFIWNGLDADATRIDVSLEQGALGFTKITIRDNGHGIPFADAPTLFTWLGGSWKNLGSHTKTKGRLLHGSEGRGRFKAFALGRVANWHVTYRAEDGSLRAYEISMLRNNIREIRITDEQTIAKGNLGVEVVISELHRDFRSLQGELAVQELAETFALYLKDYRDVSIFHEGLQIDPGGEIESLSTLSLSDINDDGIKHTVELEIIEWRTITTRALYLCTEKGFPLSKVSTRFHVADFQFCAYLKSTFITKLHQEAMIDLAEMHPPLNNSIEEARQTIKAHFQARAAKRAHTVVEEWKAEKVYPYEGEAGSPIEEAERKVFEIVAVTASDYMPDFQTALPKNKAFHLRMLRTAIEKSPHELQVILNEVLELPKWKQGELASLLQEASLSSIINASKIVADRLKFLAGLELILFAPDIKTRLKERSQLHQILTDNTWVFGEEYNLSVSDRSLTEVLRKHRKLLGEEMVIDKPVKHISQERGIVDLMLSRALRRHRADELEHLIIELKRPKVKIGVPEVTQIEKYAISVANDERFRTANGITWAFWVISDEVDQYATYRMDEGGIVSSKNNITVGVKTWAQIIEENKARLQFFQEKLEHQVDDGTALRHLQERYQRFLSGVVSEEHIESRSEQATKKMSVDD